MGVGGFGDGKTALKAGINRYVNAATVGVVSLLAPAISSVNSTTRSRTDSNRNFLPDCDLTHPAINREWGAMANANFGKFAPVTNPDPDWATGWGRRGSNWQTSLTVDRELMPGGTPVLFNNTITNQATWLQPTQILDARLAKFSVQLDF